jgi:hypothetical protein
MKNKQKQQVNPKPSNVLYTLLGAVFCSHIWKMEEKIFLREERIKDGGVSYGCPTYSNYKFYGIKQKCFKCGKTKYIEKGVMIL